MERSQPKQSTRVRTRSGLASLVLLGASALFAALSANNATAQLCDGMLGIYQQGALVGLVWVPPTADQCNYVEHWYLGPAYVYPNSPGPGRFIETTLKAADLGAEFSDVAEFRAYARAVLPGGKRVVAFATELEECGH